MSIAYKVLDENMKAVGLMGAEKIQYILGRWTKPNKIFTKDPRARNGLWVTPTLGAAKWYRRYLLHKHKIHARIFMCDIGKILRVSSCRIKTNKVFLLNEM
jgi:hypothetical protein